MIDDLIDDTDSPALRRLYAALGLLWLPFAFLLAVLWATIGSLVSIFSCLAQDAWDTLRHDVLTAGSDLTYTLRTGDTPT